MKKTPEKWDRRKREKTRWFRDALRLQQGDRVIEGLTRITKIVASLNTRDEFTVRFEDHGNLITNLAFLLDRVKMERWAIESLECWLNGPEDQQEWETYIYNLAGIPQPKPKSLDPIIEEKPKPTPAAAPTPPPPASPPAEVFEVGDSLIAIALLR